MLNTNIIRKPLLVAFAVILAFASLLPLLGVDTVNAAQVTTRSITMSSSVNAATGVDYDVSFDIGSSHTVGSIAIQFCSNSPIIGDSCTAPGGTFTVDTATEAAGAGNDLGTPGTYTKDETETVANRFVAAVDTASADTAGDTARIVLSGVTNPSTANTTFYARVFTYTTAATKRLATVSVSSFV